MKTPRQIVLVLAVSAMVVGAGGVTPVAAVTYDLTASWVYPSSTNYWSDFAIRFVDTDDDGKFGGLLEGDVVVSWTGVTQHALTFDAFFDFVGGVPTYGAFLDGGCETIYPGPPEVHEPSWVFVNTDTGYFAFPKAEYWMYNRSTVPLPPSAFLLASGLIPLAWARRKKRLGK